MKIDLFGEIIVIGFGCYLFLVGTFFKELKRVGLIENFIQYDKRHQFIPKQYINFISKQWNLIIYQICIWFNFIKFYLSFPALNNENCFKITIDFQKDVFDSFITRLKTAQDLDKKVNQWSFIKDGFLKILSRDGLKYCQN